MTSRPQLGKLWHSISTAANRTPPSTPAAIFTQVSNPTHPQNSHNNPFQHLRSTNPFFTPTSSSSSSFKLQPSRLFTATSKIWLVTPEDQQHVGKQHAIITILDRELLHLDPQNPVTLVIHQIKVVLSHDPNTSDHHQKILSILQCALYRLKDNPIAVAHLHILSQRVLAKLGHLDDLRLWKKSATALIPNLCEDKPLPNDNQVLGISCYVKPPPPNNRDTLNLNAIGPNVESPAVTDPLPAPTNRHLSPVALKPYLNLMSNKLLLASNAKNLTTATQIFTELTSKQLTPLGDATQAYFNLLVCMSSTKNKYGISPDITPDSAFHTLLSIESNACPSVPKLARHTYFLFNSYLSACCSANCAHKAFEIYTLMKQTLNQVPDLKTIIKMFTILGSPGNPKQMAQPHDSHTLSSKVSPSPFCALSAMVTVLADLQSYNIQPYPLLFNIALGKAVSQSQLHTARSIFTQMMDQKVVPTAVTYSTLIKGELSLGDPTNAWSYFKAMCSHPNAQHSAKHTDRVQFSNSIGPFNALIQYFTCTAKNYTLAHTVFEILEQQFTPIIKPTGYTLHLMVIGTMHKNPDSIRATVNALDLVRSMCAKYAIAANASHFIPILDVLVNKALYQLARSVVTAMRRELRVNVRGDVIEKLVALIFSRTDGMRAGFTHA